MIVFVKNEGEYRLFFRKMVLVELYKARRYTETRSNNDGIGEKTNMDNWKKQALSNQIKISYIGGGSRGWAWGLMSDLIKHGHQIGGVVSLYDIDFEAAKSNEIIANKILHRSKQKVN